LDLPNAPGLTNYLSLSKAQIDDFIEKLDKFDSFSILPPGKIPPNPNELLMNTKVDEMFVKLKKDYDYIIVVTAPVSLVSDTIMLAKYADTFVYVVRANVLDKRMLHIPKMLYKENKLPNMVVILNDTQVIKGYGYGYGYGIAVEKKPWYKDYF